MQHSQILIYHCFNAADNKNFTLYCFLRNNSRRIITLYMFYWIIFTTPLSASTSTISPSFSARGGSAFGGNFFNHAFSNINLYEIAVAQYLSRDFSFYNAGNFELAGNNSGMADHASLISDNRFRFAH